MRLRQGDEPAWTRSCLAGATATLLFNKPSTRSRILFHFAAVEMGGVPLSLDEDRFHPAEDWEELCTGRRMGPTISLRQRNDYLS